MPAPGRGINVDAPSAACDYNLRGLARSGRCPECGTLVARSLELAAHGLTGPERAWLWRQVRACYVLLAAAAWELVSAIALSPYQRPSFWLVSRAAGTVLVAYSLWTLGGAEPDAVDGRVSYFRRLVMRGGRKLIMRVGVVAWLLFPPLLELLKDRSSETLMTIVFVGLAGGTAATCAALAQFTRLAWWFGWTFTSRQLAALALVSTLLFVPLVIVAGPPTLTWSGPASSSSNVVPVLLDLRGVPDALDDAWRRFPRPKAILPLLIGPAWSAWSVGLLAWMCWRLSVAVPRIARKIPSSSPP